MKWVIKSHATVEVVVAKSRAEALDKYIHRHYNKTEGFFMDLELIGMVDDEYGAEPHCHVYHATVGSGPAICSCGEWRPDGKNEDSDVGFPPGNHPMETYDPVVMKKKG
jgi:hypothetical protein